MRENFWDLACDMIQLWRLLLVFVVVLFAMLGLSFPFVEHGSDSYYISVISIAILLPMLISSLYVLRRCSMRNRRQPDETSPEADSSPATEE